MLHPEFSLAHRPAPNTYVFNTGLKEVAYLNRMSGICHDFEKQVPIEYPELVFLLSGFHLEATRRMRQVVEHIAGTQGDAHTPEITEYRLDSRIIAEKLGIEHRALLQLLGAYTSKIQAFGTFAFEMRKSAGRPTRYALLNENQCYLIATLSRNTDRVVDFKVWLVRTFAEHRQGVNRVSQPAQPPELPPSASIRRWSAMTGRSPESVTRQIRRVFGAGFSLDTVLTYSQWIDLYSGREHCKRLPKPRYHTVSGWLSLHNFRPKSLEQSQQLGRKCTALSNELGYEIRKAPSEQFGEVNAYHTDVLKLAVPITNPPF